MLLPLLPSSLIPEHTPHRAMRGTPTKQEGEDDAPAKEEGKDDAPAKEEGKDDAPAKEEGKDDAPVKEEGGDDAPAKEEGGDDVSTSVITVLSEEVPGGFTIHQLRRKCSELGLSHKGKKQDLIDRLACFRSDPVLEK